MLVFQLFGQAHVTFDTVEKFVSAANSAYAAALTVILFLIFVVNQLALAAKILSE